MSDEIHLDVCARTHPGCVRDHNEDAFLIGDLDAGALWTEDALWSRALSPRGPLMLVCDGMGGAAAGEVASALAARTVWTAMRDAQATADRSVQARLLRRAVRIANRRVWDEGRRSAARRGMGTTVSAAAMAGSGLLLAQVGDSRAYVLRGERLTQVTRDQSVVSALVQAGRITEDEAKVTPMANVILQALGVRRDVEVALSIVDARRGDRVLLCSDGLHGPVPDAVIAELLAARRPLPDIASALVEAACAAGGPDNVTVLIADLSGPGLAPPSGADDQPRFIELDPMEEGERALATTSRVARRLAARAGIGRDPGGPVVPATGQHDIYPPELDDFAPDPDITGPATRVLAERERLGLIAWTLIGLAVAVGAAVLLWDIL